MAHRRPLIAIGLVAVVLLCAATSAAALGASAYQRSADYPGALLVSAHNVYQVSPHVYLRRDTSYRTTDAFPQVYHWYSRGFDLGPEVRAESACIYLQRATTTFVLEQYFGVMVCDTPAGRMMFVQRSVALRYRH